MVRGLQERCCFAVKHGIGDSPDLYLTGKSSESSTVGSRELWLDLGSRTGTFGEL